MLRSACLCLCSLLPATAAVAGAWPAGKGNVFLSVAYEWTALQDELLAYSGLRGEIELEAGETLEFDPETFGYSSVYGEIGVTDWLTFGIDAGQENLPDTYQAIFFAVLAVSPPEWRLKLALEFGVGQREFPADPDDFALIQDLRPGGREVVLRPGLSIGYGFGLGERSGWVALDLRQEQRQERDETVQKADLTLGLAPGEKSLAYLQAQYSDYPLSEPNLRLVPTYVRKVTEHISIETAILGDVWGSGDRIGLRAGLWLRF